MGQQLVERIRLIQAAQTVVREHHLLIEAPAGYGKSVFLQQLMQYMPNAARLRLTIADNDLALVKTWVREADADVLIFDDAHLISAESPTATWLYEQLKKTDNRVLIAGRYLPFDAKPLLATGAATRWDETELAFSAEFTANLLQDSNAKWQELVNGWPIGVGLLRQLPPRQRHIDVALEKLPLYLGDLILADLPPDLHRFMMVTAVAIEFSAELAASLLNITKAQAAELLETVKKRNLFIYPGATDGQWVYHDLIREAFKSRLSATESNELESNIIQWLANAQQLPKGIEFALSACRYKEAIALIELCAEAYQGNGLVLTYRRWIKTIPLALFETHLDLLHNYIRIVQTMPDHLNECDEVLDFIEASAREHNDQVNLLRANVTRGRMVVKIGYHAKAAAIYAESRHLWHLLPKKEFMRFSVSNIVCLAHSGAVQKALREYREFVAVADNAKQTPIDATSSGENSSRAWLLLIVELLIPIGRLAEAQRRLQPLASQDLTPFEQAYVSEAWSNYFRRLGRWKEAGAMMQKWRNRLAELSEDGTQTDKRLWLLAGEAEHAIATGDFATAQSIIAVLEPVTAIYPVAKYVLGIIKLRHLIAQTKFSEAQAYAEELLSLDLNLQVHRSTIALLRDIAVGLQPPSEQRFALHSETALIVHYRMLPEMILLRMLLAIVCQRQQAENWCHHAKSAVRMARKRDEMTLLSGVVPVLSRQFWLLMLEEGIERALTKQMLIELQPIPELMQLLSDSGPDLRQDIANVLAQIGSEQAMDGLNVAISAETNPPTKQALQAALTTLEA